MSVCLVLLEPEQLYGPGWLDPVQGLFPDVEADLLLPGSLVKL